MAARHPLSQLGRRNQRQKSDVAQKMVAMCLHELSSQLVRAHPELRVEAASYIEAVRRTFGTSCAFCGLPLPTDTHVEHLDAMNRVRAGLHVAGNVVLSCKRCNNAKRNDDQGRHDGVLDGRSGWDRYLRHDGHPCAAGCTTCAHWRERFPDGGERARHLSERLHLMTAFRAEYRADELSLSRDTIAAKLEDLYRRWQDAAERDTEIFATEALGAIRPFLNF